MPATRIASSCRWTCSKCRESISGIVYFHANDQDKNTVKCPRCKRQMTPEYHGVRHQNIFPFTSTHIDGQGTPITIESLHHMRKVEKQYGVVLTHTGEDSPKDLPKHRPGGREIEG